MSADRSPELARTTLQLLALGALIGTSVWIMLAESVSAPNPYDERTP